MDRYSSFHDRADALDKAAREKAAAIEGAAPDMLAALKLALADFGPDFQGPTIDAMRAAVAKAEGRSNG